MAGLTVLLTQIETQIETLRAARRVLGSEQLARIMAVQLAPHFAVEFEDRMRSLETLLGQVRKRKDVGNGWSELALQAVQATDLYERFLGYVQAEIFRVSGLDQGAGIIADGLLREVAAATDLPWRRQALVGGGDEFEERTEVVRIRFPQYSIWLAPIVIHELGHFAATRIRRQDGSTPRQLIADLASRGLDGRREDARETLRLQRADYLEELFADVFATWVLGPAYACTCLLLELRPGDEVRRIEEERGGAWRHPPAGARARAILDCLSRLDSDSVGSPYANVLARLAEVWTGPTRQAEVVDVSGATSEFIDLLASRLPRAARHQGWAGNVAITRLAGQLREAEPRAVGMAEPIRTMLNAAWLARLGAEDELMSRRVGQNAQRLILARARTILGLEEIPSV